MCQKAGILSHWYRAGVVSRKLAQDIVRWPEEDAGLKEFVDHPPHTASQAKPAARSLAKLPGAAPLGAAAARPSAGNAATAPVRSTADRWCKSMVTLALGQGPEPKTGPTHQVQVVPLRKWMPEAPGSQPTGSEHGDPSPVSVDDNNLIYAQLMLHEHSSMWSESHTRYQDDTGSSKRLWLGSSARPPAAALPGPPAPAGPP